MTTARTTLFLLTFLAFLQLSCAAPVRKRRDYEVVPVAPHLAARDDADVTFDATVVYTDPNVLTNTIWELYTPSAAIVTIMETIGDVPASTAEASTEAPTTEEPQETTDAAPEPETPSSAETSDDTTTYTLTSTLTEVNPSTTFGPQIVTITSTPESSDPATDPTDAATDAATEAATEATTEAAADPTTIVETVPTTNVQVDTYTSGTIVQSTLTVNSPDPTTTISASDSESSPVSVSGRPDYIVYSPYNDDSSCKAYDTVYADLTLVKNKGIAAIRMYATDCNSLQTVQPICEQLGLKIMQGFWIGPEGVDSIDSSVSDLINYVKSSTSGWSLYPQILVGNEAVYGGYVTADALLQKIQSVKQQLRDAGYTGPVSTAEPPNIYQDSPQLCTDDALDFVGINAHPYFDASSTADQSGSFVLGQIAVAKGVCNNKDVLVVETGYPTQGDTNGGQVPSQDNQRASIDSILQSVGSQFVLLTMYNDYWKDPGAYGVEQYFGAIDLF